MSTVRGQANRSARLTIGRALTGAITVTVLAAAISEALIALGIVGIDASDYGWDVRGLIVFAAVCALFFGGPVFVVAAFTRQAGGFRAGLPAVAVAMSALLVARYFSYDPYYLPEMQRYSVATGLPGWWFALLVALALGSAALSRRDLRTGLVLIGIVMFLAGPTALVIGLGH
jgi:hypothetical protein